MKKLLLIVILTFFSGISVKALEPSDLIFEKDTSGKYIYCNNPEFIYRSNLADVSNENAKYLMNNENLTPDNYNIFISHINHTEIGDGTRWGVKEAGFDIEVDVRFVAKEDCTVKINSAGFEVPENYKYYLNGETYTNEEQWGCFGAWASYLKTEISQLDSGQKYYPVPFEPVCVSLKKGEDMWLGKYIKNYSAVPFYRPVHMVADFDIEDGICDVFVAAVRSYGTLNDRSNVAKSIAYGSYVFEHQHKGIADSKNIVNSELNFSIDDSVAAGTLLPVKVYNQYAPEGAVFNSWFTNLNPRSDPWSKYIVAESCMLGFTYNDPAKLRYYGKNVPDSEKDTVWRFDNYHSDRVEYTDKSSGLTKSGFIPNYELEWGNKEEYAASLGNFGVFQNYKINVSNEGLCDRYIKYNLNTGSDNLIILRDENKKIISPYPITKGYCGVKEKDTLACVKLPAKKTTVFYLTVILTTNYAGGMENSLEITDDAFPVKVYNSNYTKNVKRTDFTGKEYIRWDNGDILVSENLKDWKRIELNDKTKKIFKGSWSSFKIFYTGDGYIAKPCIYDGVTYYNVRDFYNRVFLLDEGFNLKEEKSFESYPSDFSFSKGIYYVDAGTKYYSKDFKEWSMLDNSFDMPVSNYGRFTAAMKNGEVYLSENGIDFKEVSYENIKPSYIDSLGKYYYFTDDSSLFLSEDGIYWTKIKCDDRIFDIAVVQNRVIINNTSEYEINIPKKIILSFKDKFFSMSLPPYIGSDGVMMIYEKSAEALLGFEGEEKYVPLRALFENAGFSVTYDEGVVYIK